ncbi:MAG: hypothetical protein H6721_24710 [Sandaracinus sp.]|nr:hypothetical protein [Sandaracinus sp.]MCB9623615.1 hypothetical protein [Sandaracinus sp.]MCB9635334.1 hypothetical protein [Sandaracinus sp.]
MTSTPFRCVCVLLLLAVGCIHNDYRPRHDVRRLVQEQLGCDDVQVAFTPPSPYVDDPVPGDPHVDLVAWGCGAVARMRCDLQRPRGGTCVPDPTYEAPDGPVAVVKVLSRYARTPEHPHREHLVLGDSEVIRSASPRAFALPVRPGPTSWRFSSSPVRRRIYWYPDYENERWREVSRSELDPGCGRDFVLDAQAGATYRVELQYEGPNRCEVRCAREVPTASGVMLTACEGFSS